jgi:hypothetical protein
MLWTVTPAVPVMVIVETPVVAPPVAVRVRTVEAWPGGVAGLGTKPDDTPDGRPVVVNVMAELKPPVGVMVMVPVVLEPWVTVYDPGPAIEKSADPEMTRLKVVVCVMLVVVPMPVTVMV